jgi:hypothetical protein
MMANKPLTEPGKKPMQVHKKKAIVNNGSPRGKR